MNDDTRTAADAVKVLLGLVWNVGLMGICSSLFPVCCSGVFQSYRASVPVDLNIKIPALILHSVMEKSTFSIDLINISI